MTKILFLIVFFALMMVSSTSKPSAAVVPFNEQSVYLIDDYAWSECTGESIHITGQLHVDVHGVINNNRINFVIHDNYQGLTGVGETTGKLYTASGRFTDVYNGNFNGSYSESMKSSIRFNTAGGGNNFVMTMQSMTSVNGNGVITVNRYRDSFRCQ
jgi:hypothetical protein